MQLAGIGLGQTAVAGGRAERDRLPEQPAQHRRQLAHNIADVEHADGENLFAAEGEQLPREAGGPIGCTLDFHDVVMARVGFRQALSQEARESLDGRQQVVEVVGDPARELADRVHLLRLPELIFERAAIGDIQGDTRSAHRLTRFVE